MDPVSLAILELAKSLGVPPVTAGVLIPLGIIVANRAARLIPDTATGPLKWFRVAMAVAGLHVKDNSGVPAAINPDGNVTRRTTADQAPEGVAQDVEQGVLLLDPTMRVDPFGRGAEALRNQQKED